MGKLNRKELSEHLFAGLKARADKKPKDNDHKADVIAASRMPWQARVAQDRGRFISVLAPRRVGKSWLVLSLALERCLRKPDSNWVCIGLARPSIKGIYWGVVKRLNKTLELGLKFHGTDLTVTFGNNSVLRFTGAESRSEVEKLRGGQYDGVIIDECKSFQPVVFGELIHEVVRPALSDRSGQLILIGTPGDILAGPFYEATCTPPIAITAADGTKRWSNWNKAEPSDGTVHIWSKHLTTLLDNTEVRTAEGKTLWQDAQEYKNVMGWNDANPVWRREYMGEWVAADNRLVYRFQPHVHVYDGNLPEGHEWLYVLGFDMGYKDSDAVVVWAYSPTHANLYEIYSEKRVKVNIGAMARWLQETREIYSPNAIVADFGGLATKVMESIADDYGIIAEPAEKKEKLDHIEILNNDFDAKRIFLNPGSALGEEMQVNRWLEASLGTEKRKEDPRTPNDLCDAALYAFRWCWHRKFVPGKVKNAMHSAEWWAEFRKSELARARSQEAQRRGDYEDFTNLDRDFGGDSWWS